jgi:hypothetical protein
MIKILTMIFIIIIILTIFYMYNFKIYHLKQINTKKLNIAVLFYGRTNKCSQCYKTIKKSIGNHNIDYFLSSDNSLEKDLNKFIEIYNPVLYNNNYISHNFMIYNYLKNKAPETNIDTMIRHFINKKRVFELLNQYILKTNKIYDVVLSIRTDLYIYDSFNFNNLDKNTIYIPNCNDFRNGINDQVAYGTIDVMKTYMNIIDNFDYLINNNLSITHPEALTLSNLKNKNIKIERFKLTYNIYRY